jgi:hypothetical protein
MIVLKWIWSIGILITFILISKTKSSKSKSFGGAEFVMAILWPVLFVVFIYFLFFGKEGDYENR